MKKLCLGALTAGLLLLSGCGGDFLPYSHDIEKVELVQTMGLDKGEDGQVQLTMSSGLRRVGDSGETKPPLVFQETGDTVYGCALEMQSQGDGYITFTHTTDCLLGEQVAQEGVEDLVDFLERDTEMRLSTDLFVVRGSTAGELIQNSAGEDSSIVDRLNAVTQDVEYTLSDSYIYTLKDLVTQLEENGCGLAPALEQGETEAETAGFACFGDCRLVGYLDREQAVGANLLLNQLSGGNVTVALSDGSTAALRLRNAHCRWVPEFQNDKLVTLRAEVTVRAGLEELRGKADPESEAIQQELVAGLEETLEDWASSTLSQCQDWGIDPLHLEKKVTLARPWRKAAVEQNWSDWYPALKLEVQVSGMVDQTYDINQPLRETKQ